MNSGEEIQSPQFRDSEEINNKKRKEVEGREDGLFVSKRPRMRATMPHQITFFRFSLPDSDCDQETSSDLDDQLESEDEADVEIDEPEDEVDVEIEESEGEADVEIEESEDEADVEIDESEDEADVEIEESEGEADIEVDEIEDECVDDEDDESEDECVDDEDDTEFPLEKFDC